jgi:hypothetical protein
MFLRAAFVRRVGFEHGNSPKGFEAALAGTTEAHVRASHVGQAIALHPQEDTPPSRVVAPLLVPHPPRVTSRRAVCFDSLSRSQFSHIRPTASHHLFGTARRPSVRSANGRPSNVQATTTRGRTKLLG